MGQLDRTRPKSEALAWRALNGVTSTLNSNLPRQTKLSFFYTTVEYPLLCGSECRTLTATLQKARDGCYELDLKTYIFISYQLSQCFYEQIYNLKKNHTFHFVESESVRISLGA